jgi:hypothetical protein
LSGELGGVPEMSDLGLEVIKAVALNHTSGSGILLDEFENGIT